MAAPSGCPIDSRDSGLHRRTGLASIVFTASATDALNLAVKGLLRPRDHCITTGAEHNALRRPLAALARQGVQVTWLPVSPEGLMNPAAVRAAVRPGVTRLIAVAHGSNVTGALQPLADLAEVAHRAGAFFLVDAAQTAGSRPIHVGRMGIHLLAAPGQKGLLGPQGRFLLPKVAFVAISLASLAGAALTGLRQGWVEWPVLGLRWAAYWLLAILLGAALWWALYLAPFLAQRPEPGAVAYAQAMLDRYRAWQKVLLSLALAALSGLLAL